MVYAFGEHELDEERFELRRGRQRVELQPKALQLLFYLVRNRERAVSKREILDAVWPDAVVTDGSLARAVSLARVAIGDRGREPAKIVTVPRRGYRFEAAVRAGPAAVLEDDSGARYVGRAQLLGRLREALDAALAGRGRIVLLAGEAGIGKTRTAEVLAERARRAGAFVAAAWGVEDGSPTYSSWTRVLRVLASGVPEAVASLEPAARADLARLLPELPRRRARHLSAAVAGDSVRFRLFDAVQALLTSCAARRPLALFLDDLHAADAESLWLLEFVGQAIGALPIAIVATSRDEDAGRTPQQARALERLLRLTSLERWPLTGLRGDEVRDFVRLRLAGDPDPALIRALERQTGGNPLLLGESLRSLEARGVLDAALAAQAWEALLPRGIQHLLQPKLRRLTPRALEVLACAAAIGVEFERELLARSLRDDTGLDEQLRAAHEASLLHGSASAGRLRFAHVLVREAVYAELVPPGDARRALHARIAAALDQVATEHDGALGARAHHACEAAPLVDPVRAVALAQAAGEDAARLHDFERAAAWHERALEVLDLAGGSDPARRATLLLGLGAAQTRAVGLERARASYRLAADHARSIGRGDLLALAALGFAHRPSATGHGDPEVLEVLEEAARAVPTPREALRIGLLSRLAAELRYAEPARAEALIDGAVADARGLGDPAVLAQTLDDCSFLRWSPADPEDWLALNAEITRAARASGDLELVLLGQKGRVTGFLELGDVAAVDREIRACERTAEALRTPYARWLCAALRAMRALLDGELEAAERHVGDSILLGERVDSPDVALELQVQLASLRLEQGRAAEIEPAAREQVRRFPDAPAWRAGLARILIAADQPAEAREELERLARRRFADVPRDRGWLPTLALASEVAFSTGDVRTAEILEPLLTPYARLCVVAGSGLLHYGPVQHHLGLLALVRSRWDAAIGHFESALSVEERSRARVWSARTRLACARAFLGQDSRTGRARAARLVAEASSTARAGALADVSADASELAAQIWPRRGPPRARGRRTSKS